MAVRYCYDIIYSAGHIIPYLIENIPIFTMNRLTISMRVVFIAKLMYSFDF